jgi:hypothetical protein
VVSFRLAFPPIICIRSSSPHSCYMSHQSHPPRLDYSNYTWWEVQITKLLVMQFSPPSRYLIPLRSKCRPRHPVHKHPITSTLQILSNLRLRNSNFGTRRAFAQSLKTTGDNCSSAPRQAQPVSKSPTTGDFLSEWDESDVSKMLLHIWVFLNNLQSLLDWNVTDDHKC